MTGRRGIGATAARQQIGTGLIGAGPIGTGPIGTGLIGAGLIGAGLRRGLGVAAGLIVGSLADRLLGDPTHHHPVAGFGQLAARMERRTYRDHRAAGAVHAALLVTGCAAAGVTLEQGIVRMLSARVAAPGLPPAVEVTARAAVVAGCTWVVLGGRTLEREALAVHDLLQQGDLPAARARIRSLVGRDPSRLDADELARAVIESVAENTSDAVVAPLLVGAVAGPGGLLGYRALNTLDAMIGHRSPRYLRFGWAAARADDLANWVPARVAAWLGAALAPRVGGRRQAAAAAIRGDAGRHPSPNAGQVEAAFAGALGVGLGGSNVYGELVEDRGRLGAGPPARVPDIPRATRLAAEVDGAAVLVAAGVAVTVGWLSDWRRGS